MFVGAITAGSYTAGNDIPITQVQDTNGVYGLSNNKVVVQKAGITDVKTNIVVTTTGANTVTAQLYANGSAIANAISSFSVAASSNYTLTIDYPVLIKKQLINDDVELSIRLDQDCTLVGGYLSMEYRQ